MTFHNRQQHEASACLPSSHSLGRVTPAFEFFPSDDTTAGCCMAAATKCTADSRCVKAFNAA